jgi:hypothetical protein
MMRAMTDDKQTPEAIENNEAKKNWDTVHSAYKENEATRAEDDAAWIRREKAQENFERSRKPKTLLTEQMSSEDGELNF